MKPLLEINNLSKWYFLKKGFFRRRQICVKAVDEIDFEVQKGEVFGLVGESGSGKTTIVRLILGLEKPTSGSIKFNGTTITNRSNDQLVKGFRTQLGAIFQDPFDSLNPMLNVFSIIKEPLDIAKVNIPKSQILLNVQEALMDVKLIPYEEFINKFPHELSGGQRQRVSLARALILKPNLLIADEPLSMLDVSLRAYMINLMEEMKKRYNLTILFITHDLAVARYFCDNISVIYKGKIMERGPSEVIFRDPKHPYTIALKEAVPEMRPLRESCGGRPRRRRSHSSPAGVRACGQSTPRPSLRVYV